MEIMNIKRSPQSGFTLIELIVVIVILGILAATALPKFSSLGGDARLASLGAAKGALGATAAMAKGKFLVNATGTAMTTVVAEGVTMNLHGSGYPKADTGLAAAAGLDADYTVISGVTAATSFAPANAADELTIVPKTLAASPAGLTCFLKYKEPANNNALPTYTMTATAANCQ